MKLIDFFIYRWIGGNIINPIRRFLGLKITRLYWKYEEDLRPAIFVGEDVEKELEEYIEKTVDEIDKEFPEDSI